MPAMIATGEPEAQAGPRGIYAAGPEGHSPECILRLDADTPPQGSARPEPAARSSQNPEALPPFCPSPKIGYPPLAFAAIDSRGDNHAAETTSRRIRDWQCGPKIIAVRGIRKPIARVDTGRIAADSLAIGRPRLPLIAIL